MSEFERQRYDQCVVTGDNWILPILFEDDAGNPIDLTGRVARVQVRLTQAAADPPLLNLTDGSGLMFDGPNGSVSIDTVVGLAAGDYFWELELSGGPISSPVWGKFKVEQDVVR